MAFHLRILSGKHRGAELRLSARRYSLGSGEDNALILSDDAIAEHHISFFFAQGEISVLRAPGGLLVDGKKVGNFPIDIAPWQVMTLAGTNEDDNISIAFGEAEAEEWPDDKKIATLLLQGANTKDDKQGTPKTRHAEKRLGALARLSPRRRKMLLRSSIALGVASVTIVVISLGTLLWFDPTRWQAKRMRQVEQRLERELVAKPHEQRTVRIAERKDGSIILLGYVETEKELVRLRGLAFESGLQIRVVSKEQLQSAIEVVAQQYGLYANFILSPIGEATTIVRKNKESRPTIPGERKRGDTHYSFEDFPMVDRESAAVATKMRKLETQHFRLRAEGFVEYERRVEAFRKAVLRDLPYITEVEMDVTTNEAMLASIRAALSKNAAFSGVRLDLDLGHLVMSGALFSNFHDELQAVLQKHYQNLPHAPVPKDRLTLAPPFYAEITALLLGKQRAVDLRLRTDSIAKRYLVGQIVDKNKRIAAITSNGILLDYRDETIGFPIADPAAMIPLAPNPALEIKSSGQTSIKEKTR